MTPLSKSKLVTVICDLIGTSVAKVVDSRDGWPAMVEINVAGAWRGFSMHVGSIHSMGRGKPHEYRFQNPVAATPVTVLPGTEPLLVGLWSDDEPSVLVAAQPEIRFEGTTRFSVLFPESLIRSAQRVGWAQPYQNNHGNYCWSFLPYLLPVFCESYSAGLTLQPKDVQLVVTSAGGTGDANPATIERVRVATSRLMRDSKFAGIVLRAYDFRCSMCGLNLGLVSGAHIYPVEAQDSPDTVQNGLALCDNHHRAFDNHRVWINPEDKRIRFHPETLAKADSNERSLRFIQGTFDQLVAPVNVADLPGVEMFARRYEYYDGSYAWLV